MIQKKGFFIIVGIGVVSSIVGIVLYTSVRHEQVLTTEESVEVLSSNTIDSGPTFPITSKRPHKVYIYPNEELVEVEDTLEIVAIEGTSDLITLSMDTVYDNGHFCHMEDMLFYKSDTPNEYIYDDPDAPQDTRLSMTIDRDQIRLSDPTAYYKDLYCGVRGSIDGTVFSLLD